MKGSEGGVKGSEGGVEGEWKGSGSGRGVKGESMESVLFGNYAASCRGRS